MVITPHGLTGALIGSRAETAVGALTLGLLSHLALDRVRHRDYSVTGARGRGRVAADALLLGASLVAAGARRRAIAGAIGGIAPDLVCVAWRAGWLPGAGALVRLHDHNHTRHRGGTHLELAQVAVAAGALALLVLGKDPDRRRLWR